MKGLKQNAVSFGQILAEVKKYAEVEDVYYSQHTGNWTVKFIDGDIIDFPTFFDLPEVIHTKKQADAEAEMMEQEDDTEWHDDYSDGPEYYPAPGTNLGNY